VSSTEEFLEKMRALEKEVIEKSPSVNIRHLWKLVQNTMDSIPVEETPATTLVALTNAAILSWLVMKKPEATKEVFMDLTNTSYDVMELLWNEFQSHRNV
jgi:hypothetical protein